MGSFTFSPLFQGGPLIKGFLGGCLLVGGLVSQLGLGIQIILLIAGIFSFIDSIVADGNISIIASAIAAIGGGFISVLITVLGFSAIWNGLVVVATIILYFFLFSKRKKPKS